MKIALISIWALVLCLGTGQTLFADDPPSPKSSADQEAALVSSLKWQTGPVSIKDGLAKINLTDDFRFLGPEDARKVLHNLWGNPDDPGLLGMIFPKNLGPLDRDGWAVTINYEGDGYVKDDEAAKINYDEMLKTMQQSAKDANAEREKQGYPSVELIGWAAPPRYDAAAHKLYWAKDLKFGGESGDTLNYDIRILGRHGVLVLGAISSMKDFTQINEKVPQILAMVDFQPGNTYAEFDPKIDKVAEYGLAALVAGGALAGAAKLGLFGLLLKFLVVGWKAVAVGVVALGAALKKFFGGGGTTTKVLVPPRNDPPGK